MRSYFIYLELFVIFLIFFLLLVEKNLITTFLFFSLFIFLAVILELQLFYPLRKIVANFQESKRGQEIEQLNQIFKGLKESLKSFRFHLGEAHSEIEEEKNRTLAMVDSLTDGLLLFNQQGKLLLINPQAKNFLKIEPEEVIGKRIEEISHFGKFNNLVEILGIGKIREIFREELPLAEDSILEVSTIPIKRENEKIGTLAILHDVTREKRVDAMKSEFVTISAHQLRTPLSAIKWTLEMLLEGDLGELNEKQKEHLKMTFHSNERMINLVNNLLNLAVIEEGRYLHNLVPTNIEEICQSVIDYFKLAIEQKKINFIFNRPKEKIKTISIDKEKIFLVIQNLIDNALRYTQNCGQVAVFLKSDNIKIEFCIKDNGIGIPKNQLPKVFSKFFRAPNAVKLETEGNGLGLYIAKNIIEAHKGRIWFESIEGKGSTFCFNLPY